jgi:hypothetical protein
MAFYLKKINHVTNATKAASDGYTSTGGPISVSNFM